MGLHSFKIIQIVYMFLRALIIFFLIYKDDFYEHYEHQNLMEIFNKFDMLGHLTVNHFYLSSCKLKDNNIHIRNISIEK